MSQYLSPIGILGLVVFLFVGFFQWRTVFGYLLHYNYPYSDTYKRILSHPYFFFPQAGLLVLGIVWFLFYGLTSVASFLVWYEPISVKETVHIHYKNREQERIYITFTSFYIIAVVLNIARGYTLVAERTEANVGPKEEIQRPALWAAFTLSCLLQIISILLAVFCYFVQNVGAAFYTGYAVGYLFDFLFTLNAWVVSGDADWPKDGRVSNNEYFYGSKPEGKT